MPLRQPPVRQKGLQIRRQLQEAQQVRDRAAILPRSLPNLLVAEVQLFGQALESDRRLDRVQVLTLDVLDERDLKQPVIRHFLDDDRHALETCEPGGAPAAFSGYK